MNQRLSPRAVSPLRWLRTAGVSRAAEHGLETQVAVANGLTLVAACLYGLGLVSDLFMPTSWMLGLDIFALASHLSVPVLNHFGWTKVSRVFFVLSLNSVIFIATAAEGPASGMQYLFLTFVGLPLVLFDLQERGPLAFGIALPIVCYVALDLGGYQALLPEWMHLPTSHTIFWDSIASAFLFSFLTVLYFFMANRRAMRVLQEHQARMVASSKLSALGEMAGGVAHEINNPLSIITLLSTRLKQLVSARPVELAALQRVAIDVESNTQRVAAIVRSLQAFARDGSQRPVEPVLVADMVSEALGFCRERFHHHRIDLRVLPISKDLVVRGRQVEFTEILLNLFNNAYEAVSRQAPNDESERWVEIEARHADAFVEILVTDSGPGVPAKLRDRVFEPFFTTKSIGQGTGLGLSASLGLAQRYGGNLRLETSSPATCFVLALPRLERG